MHPFTLYNTRTRRTEPVRPLNPPTVTFYACGPTVYDYTHIGHIRKYLMDDLLKRTLTYLGYHVHHVMNITDVGHLSGDDDTGEDKLEKGATKYNKSVWDIATMYTEFFHTTMEQVQVLPPQDECKATDHIEQMITLIATLQKKGMTYETPEAVYFDITKFPSYGALSGQKLQEKKQAVRSEVHTDPQKKHPADFALWLKRVGRFATHTMHWQSPWGDGFPGWHIECSAMSMAYLGEQIDIHSGGIDHIPVHHENEIAQSEGATGKQFVSHWVHHNFVTVEGEKMSKSKGNFTTIKQVCDKGIDPVALRLLFLQSHYRQEVNFTWEAAHAADTAYRKIQREYQHRWKETNGNPIPLTKQGKSYKKTFRDALANDLQTAQALATVWEMLRADLPAGEQLALLQDFNQVLGLYLPSEGQDEIIPEDIINLAEQRKKNKQNKDYAAADTLRAQIEARGYRIQDRAEGYSIEKKGINKKTEKKSPPTL